MTRSARPVISPLAVSSVRCQASRARSVATAAADTGDRNPLVTDGPRPHAPVGQAIRAVKVTRAPSPCAPRGRVGRRVPAQRRRPGGALPPDGRGHRPRARAAGHGGHRRAETAYLLFLRQVQRLEPTSPWSRYGQPPPSSPRRVTATSASMLHSLIGGHPASQSLLTMFRTGPHPGELVRTSPEWASTVPGTHP
jgi:hypothetical protein